MAPEKVTVTIESSAGEDASLTVNDAMRQILDFFELLEAAGGPQSKAIAWNLVSVSMNSPLQATAEAVPVEAGIIAAEIARVEKEVLEHSFRQLLSDEVPDWLDGQARERAVRLFSRTLNGVGRTDIRFREDEPPLSISRPAAEIALFALKREDAGGLHLDLSRTEFGSIEANVIDATTYRGQPAIRVKDRISAAIFPCVFTQELAQKIGPKHSWAEVWSNRRVLIVGKVTYRKDGQPTIIYADEIREIDPKPLRYKDIADPNFTGGLKTSEYLGSIWED